MLKNNTFESDLRRFLLLLALLSLTQGAAFTISRLIPAGSTSNRQRSINEMIRPIYQGGQDCKKTLKTRPKLSLRGGGTEPSPTEDTEACSSRHRDILPDMTCAFKDKADPRSVDHLEEEDVDGPHSDRGDVSEVPSASFEAHPKDPLTSTD